MFPPAQFKNNYFTEMCIGSEAGSYLRLIEREGGTFARRVLEHPGGP